MTNTQNTETRITPDPNHPKHHFKVEQFKDAGTMVTEVYGERTIGFAAMGPVSSPEAAVETYRNEWTEDED